MSTVEYVFLGQRSFTLLLVTFTNGKLVGVTSTDSRSPLTGGKEGETSRKEGEGRKEGRKETRK